MLAVGGSGQAVAARAEVRGNWAIRGAEALGVARVFAAAHPPLALPRGLVRMLRPVVQPLVLPMLDARQHLPQRGPVAGERVGDHHAWHIRGSSAFSLHQGGEWGAQGAKWGHLRALPLVHCPDAVPSGEAGGRCSESAEEPIREPFKPLAQELRGGLLVATGLHADIEPLPVLINGPPAVVLPPINLDEDRVEMPLVTRPGSPTA